MMGDCSLVCSRWSKYLALIFILTGVTISALVHLSHQFSSNTNTTLKFYFFLLFRLIESSLKSPLPRYMAIEINEHSLNLILEYLLSSNCPLKINADIGNMQQMLCVIISILGSKCATGINSSEVEHLAILLLRVRMQINVQTVFKINLCSKKPTLLYFYWIIKVGFFLDSG